MARLLKAGQKKKGLKRNIDEQAEWLRLTPSERFQQTTKLWQLYLALGGRLDSKPDPQGPFGF